MAEVCGVNLCRTDIYKIVIKHFSNTTESHFIFTQSNLVFEKTLAFFLNIYIGHVHFNCHLVSVTFSIYSIYFISLSAKASNRKTIVGKIYIIYILIRFNSTQFDLRCKNVNAYFRQSITVIKYIYHLNERNFPQHIC